MIGTSIGNSLIWDNGTNVGIGNTNTSYTLDVSGTGNFTGALTGTSATFSSSVTTTNLIASSSLNGDPALATFTNANGGASAESTIYIRNSAANSDATFIQALGTAFTTTGGFVQDGGVIGSSTGLSGGLSLMVRANADMRFYTNGHTNERMRITSAGNVGIGTSSPNLTAASRTTVDINGTSTSLLSFSTGGTNKGYLYNDGTNLTINTTGVLAFEAGSVERMRITSGGEILVAGTYNPFALANRGNITLNGTNSNILAFTNGSDAKGYIFHNQTDMEVINRAVGNLSFATSNTERMRITSGGNVGINANGTNAQLDIKSSTNSNPVIYGYNTSSAPYGMRIIYSTTPNNSDNWFLYADDSTGQRFSVRSNGGVYNYTGNNVPLSDQRMKKEIAPLESYWDKFKSIEMVKFKYIDQTHDDFNIGVVSQQIESIMPEFVDVWDEKNIPEDGKPLMGVYMEDIHNIAMKVLQEAMTKIEEQQIQIQNLQEQINILSK